MSPFQLKSMFDAPIFEIDAEDLQIKEINARFLFIAKIKNEENSEKEAKIFLEKLCTAFKIPTEEYTIICCKTLPNNLSAFLAEDKKVVCFGFNGTANSKIIFTYNYEALQNLPTAQKKQVWAGLKAFVG